jgi:hypothetical protein
MKKLILISVILMLVLGFSGQSTAGISIGINIPIPPLFAFPAPPELVVIPGTYAYYCPDVGVNIFFYAGYWYRPYEGYWYRSVSYDGPWVYIESVPYVLLNLPPDYRAITWGESPIPYVELHRNWRTWERDRYWEHHNWGRVEHERHYGVTPSYRYSGNHNWGGAENQRHYGMAPSYRYGGNHNWGGAEHDRHYGMTPSDRYGGNHQWTGAGHETHYGNAPSFGNAGHGGSHGEGRYQEHGRH